MSMKPGRGGRAGRGLRSVRGERVSTCRGVRIKGGKPGETKGSGWNLFLAEQRVNGLRSGAGLTRKGLG